MNTRTLICVAAIAAALAACKPKEEETGKVSEGRKETESIERVDDIGYAGSATRKKVDKALDTNDNRVNQLDEQIDSQ